MKTLTTVMSLVEADLLCAKLQAHGIEAVVPDQSTISAQPLFANTIGGIRIQVSESDLVQAKQFLGADLPPSDPGIFTCPQCGSDSVGYERISRRLAFASLLLLGIPLLWIKRQCKCSACNHKWKDG